MYADDNFLVADKPQNLKVQLKAVEVFVLENDLEINVKKTKILITNPKDEFTFTLCDQQIERVKTFKYLGF